MAGHGFNTFKDLNEWKNAGAHNAFVLVAVETGLVGVLLFGLVLGSVFYMLCRRLLEPNANHVALGWGMALFVFLLTASMVDTSVNRKYLWFVLGIITLLVRFHGRTPAGAVPPPGDPAVDSGKIARPLPAHARAPRSAAPRTFLRASGPNSIRPRHGNESH